MLLRVPFSTINLVNFSCVSEEFKLMVRWGGKLAGAHLCSLGWLAGGFGDRWTVLF